MGDKIESKKLAKKAGVNVVPGYLGDIATTDEAVKIAKDIGYPVMMKASAGGGGKGMRLAYDEKDVREGFEATKREGLSSFGDDRVFIEKFIEDPRHIEIQVLGDKHGNILYLNERECSIQRRHQKVIEEAPSPFVSPEMRKSMGEQCVALARAVGYHSAGTVELIVSGADTTGKSFYFLEMNTRLQVEHPVTEEVTGLDLVEQMIRVAAGEKLAFTQDEVKLNGWSIEARVYAEDPYRGFLPSTGRLTTYRPPAPHRDGDSVIRVDDGVTEGGEISMFYDPMIAKLISWAPTRDEAIDEAVQALDAFQLSGISDNIDFLSALLQHKRFKAGELTTGFIAEEYPEGFTGAPADEALLNDLAALAGIVQLTSDTRASLIDGQLGDPVFPEATQIVRIGKRDFTVTIAPYDGGNLAIVDDRDAIDVVGDWSPGDKLLVADMDGRSRIVQVARKGRGWIADDARRRASGSGHAAAHRRARHAHDRKGAAGYEPVPAGSDAGAVDPAGGQGRRHGRGGTAGRGGRGDEDGEYPPRREERDGQGDRCQGRRQPGGRSDHRGVRMRCSPTNAGVQER